MVNCELPIETSKLLFDLLDLALNIKPIGQRRARAVEVAEFGFLRPQGLIVRVDQALDLRSAILQLRTPLPRDRFTLGDGLSFFHQDVRDPPLDGREDLGPRLGAQLAIGDYGEV